MANEKATKVEVTNNADNTSKSFNARAEALVIITETLENGAYLQSELNKTLEKHQYLKKQDRAFISRLCEGTVEEKIYIDYVINLFSTIKVNKMKAIIRNILRMGVYQLLFMDGVPDSAACNEAVKIATKKGFRNLKGFVNGVLRTIGREKDKIVLPSKKKEPVKFLSISYSMPEWIVEEFIETYGFEITEKIIDSLLETKELTIRLNESKGSKEILLSKLEEENITVKEGNYLPYAFNISNYNYINKIKAFKEGYFQIQDESSMLVAEIAGVKKDDYVIDVCAAPGGKSLHIADKLKNSGKVSARDLTEYKVALINENKERLGIKNLEALVLDALTFTAEDRKKADIVIADLPCSGLGVIGKKADIKYRMTKEQQEILSDLQKDILNVVCDYVKIGGTLIYSTCTINKHENEENVEWFLKEHADFEIEDLTNYLPKDIVSDTLSKGYIQLLPGIQKTDGFFLAKFKRKILKEQE